ncbi:MAG: NADPH-dependent F420 reductase [Gammaproteobacteria bacterium]
MSDTKPKLAVLGGTGDLGAGLAYAWARAGYPIIIGSRSAERGAAKGVEIRAAVAGAQVDGGDLQYAARGADIVVVTVPYASHAGTLEAVKDAVAGKIVIDTTVPLVPPKVARVQLPAAGCAAAEAQQVLGAGVRVVSAFQNVSAHSLMDGSADCDVLVCGDDVDAREQVIGLVAAIGLKGWHAGVLANSAAAEALTSVLISINKRYQLPGSGIRITTGGH